MRGRLFAIAAVLVAALALAGVAGASSVPAPPKGLRAVLVADGYQYVGGHRDTYKGKSTLDYLSRTRDHRRARLAIGTGRGPAYVLGVALGFKVVGPVRDAVERELGMHITRVSTWGPYVVLHVSK